MDVLNSQGYDQLSRDAMLVVYPDELSEHQVIFNSSPYGDNVPHLFTIPGLASIKDNCPWPSVPGYMNHLVGQASSYTQSLIYQTALEIYPDANLTYGYNQADTALVLTRVPKWRSPNSPYSFGQTLFISHGHNFGLTSEDISPFEVCPIDFSLATLTSDTAPQHEWSKAFLRFIENQISGFTQGLLATEHGLEIHLNDELDAVLQNKDYFSKFLRPLSLGLKYFNDALSSRLLQGDLASRIALVNRMVSCGRGEFIAEGIPDFIELSECPIQTIGNIDELMNMLSEPDLLKRLKDGIGASFFYKMINGKNSIVVEPLLLKGPGGLFEPWLKGVLDRNDVSLEDFQEFCVRYINFIDGLVEKLEPGTWKYGPAYSRFQALANV